MSGPSERIASERIAVVTDSGAVIPDDLRRELEIHVAPLTVELDGVVYADGIDEAPSDFYERMVRSRSTPRTSQPSPGAYLTIFERLAGKADRILCLSLSAKLSGTYACAAQAAQIFQKSLEERPAAQDRPDPRGSARAQSGPQIEVMDTKLGANPHGLVVIEAARVAKKGGSWAEVVRRAREVAVRARMLVVVDTMEYIVRGGHAPKLAGLAAAALGIKPLIKLRNGDAVPAGVATSLDHAYSVMCRHMRREGRKVERARGRPAELHVAVSHAGARDRGEHLLAMVREALHPTEAYLSDFTPVMGAHTGPGLVGVGWFAE